MKSGYMVRTASRKRILITGGAGFIGSALVRRLIRNGEATVFNCDRLTYAAVPAALEETANDPRYEFSKIDVCDRKSVEAMFHEYRPTGVMHLAAETHVDRSIDEPLDFVRTNVLGTAVLLDVSYSYYCSLKADEQAAFRFHYVSTDEVFGMLNGGDPPFTEKAHYAPSSPYSASKAGADHLVRAWHRTLGLPVLITHGSNTFGPWQFPDKFIPMLIINALRGQHLPIYGTGRNVRDWIFVEDHAEVLWRVFCGGVAGESYNVAGHNEYTNRTVALKVCHLLDVMIPRSRYKPHEQLIRYVPDRPGHDFRYALDTSKVSQALEWCPRYDFDSALQMSIRWYIEHRHWWERILSSSYQGMRLGMTPTMRAG